MSKEIILFGSPHCGDCDPVLKILDANNVRYTFINISSDMPNLKMFMKIRDLSPAFEEIRGTDRVGIPCLQVDGEIFVIDDEEMIMQVIKQKV